MLLWCTGVAERNGHVSNEQIPDAFFQPTNSLEPFPTEEEQGNDFLFYNNIPKILIYNNFSSGVVGGSEVYTSTDEMENSTLSNGAVNEMFNLSSSG